MKRFLALSLFIAITYPSSGSAEETFNNTYISDPNRIEWRSAALFEGTFEGGTPFFLKFPYPVPRSVATASPVLDRQSKTGSYWYPRQFRGVPITFEVESFHDNVFWIVTNFDHDQEVFEGTLSADQQQAKGTWTNGKQTKKLAFSMHLVVAYKSIYIKRSGADAVEFNTSFPIFPDPVLASWINKIATTCYEDKCSNGVEILWYSNKLISLSGLTWGYGSGTPHGHSETEYMHFSISSGNPIAVDLDHFIGTSLDCDDDISRRIIERLLKQNPSAANWAENITEHGVSQFLATPQGILFSVDDGTGAYIHQSADVFLDRRQLGNCLKQLPSYP